MKKTTARETDLETLALLAAVSLVLSFIFHKPAFVLLALGLLVLALLFKKASARLTALWLRFSELLGGVNTKVVLGAVYYLLLTPLALVFRLLNGNALRDKADPALETYFSGKKRQFTPADLEKPW